MGDYINSFSPSKPHLIVSDGFTSLNSERTEFKRHLFKEGVTHSNEF